MALKQIDPGIQIAAMAPAGGRTTVPHIVTFSGITSTLAKVYRQPDEALRQSVHNAAMMRRDPMIMGPLLARQQAVALLPWSIVPEDEKNTELRQVASSLEDIVRRTPRLTEYFRNLMEAIWYGKQAAQHGWGKTRNREGRAVRYIQRWVPMLGDKLVFRFDDGKGEFDPDQIGIKVTPAWARSNIVLGEPDLEYTSEGSAVFLNRWQRTRLAVHKHLVMDGDYIEPWSAGMIHGVGLRHFLYWCWFQKQETLAQLSEVVERTGMGFTIYYYPAGNERAQAEVREIAEQQPNKNQIIMPFDPSNPDAYRVEQIPPNTGGITALSHLIDDYFGNWIIRFILGQTLSMRADATGMGSGLSDLQKDSFLQIVRYDATNLEETLTTDLVQPLLLFNFPKYRNTRFFLKIATESSVPAEKLQALQMAWSMGAKIRTQDVLDMVGAATPGDDDDTVWNPGVVGAMMQIGQEQQKAAQPQPQGGGGGGLEEAYAALMGGGPAQQSKRYGKGWDPEVEKLPSLVANRKHPGIRVVRDERGWHATDPETGVAAYVNDDESIRYTHGDPIDVEGDFDSLAREAVKNAKLQQEMSVWKEFDPERYAEADRGLLPKSVPSGQTIKGSGDIFNELKDLHGETDNHEDASWILPSGEMVSNGGAKTSEEQSWRHHDVVSLFEEHSPDVLKDKKKRSASAIRAMQRFGAAPVLQHEDGTFHLEIRNDLSSAQLDRIRNVVQSGRPVSVSIIADVFDRNGKSRGEDEVYHGRASSLDEVEDLADAVRRRTVEKGDPAGDEILEKLKGSKHSAVSLLESGRVLVPSRSGKPRPNMRDAYLYTMDFSGASKNKLDKDTKANNKKIAEALHDEALMALRHSSDAIGWYSRTFQKAAKAYETAFPEIKTDPGKRAVFMALLAVTSNGVSVPVNNNLAARIFRDYMQNNGEIDPEDYVYPGKSAEAIKGHVRLINELLQEHGEGGLAQFLGQQMKAGDVWKNAFKDQTGLKKSAAGEHVDEDVRGSNVFGPKLGSFYNNLNQNFDSVTMDRWFTRTIRRIMGTLADPNKDSMPGQIERILRSFGVKGAVSGQIEEVDDDDDEDDDTPRRTRKINLDKIAADPNLAGSDEYRSARTKTVKRDGVSVQVPAFHLKTKDIVRDLLKMQQTGKLAKNSAGMQFILDREFWRQKTEHKDKAEINQAAHRLHENLYGLNDAPGSASERRRIRGIMQQTQEMLGKSGYQMDMADLQALLWYSEKRLMPHLGIVNSRQLPDDYARQAQLWVDQFLRGDFDDDSAAQPRNPRGSGSRIGSAGPRPKPARVARGAGASQTAAALFAAAPDRNAKQSSPDRYIAPLAAIPVAAAAAPAAATAGTAATAATAGTAATAATAGTAATTGMTLGQAANIAANVAPLAIGAGKGLAGLAAGPEGVDSSKYEQSPDSFGVGTEATGAPMFSYDTPQRYSSEDSDEFKTWFGGSVVHDNGKPLVVYHGTPDARGLLSDGFKISRHEGAFFATPDYRVADSYADDHRAADYQTAEPHVIPLYLRIENPMVIDNKGKRWSGTSDHIKKAKEAGHDGIVIKNTFDAYHVDKDRHGRKIKDPHDVYVWFDPNQAKSAMSAPLKSRVDQKEIGGGPNQGSWSTEDSRLTYAKDYDASLWNHESIGEQQEHQSKLTSLSQVPSTLKAVERAHGWQEGTINADIGGGRFDHFTNELGRRGVTNYIYDPFNRSKEHNHRVASAVANGRAHTATVNNVLNVIKEPEIREHVIKQAANAIKDDGKAYFLMHEGTSADQEKGSRVTKSKEGVTSWQEFRKAHTYIPEIERHFGKVARIPGTNVLVAMDPVRQDSRPQQYAEPFDGDENTPDFNDAPSYDPEPEPVETPDPEPVESEVKPKRKPGWSDPKQPGVERLKEKPTAAMKEWITKQLPEGAPKAAVKSLWKAYLDHHNAAIDEYDRHNMAAGSLSRGMEPHHAAAITKAMNQGGDFDSKKLRGILGNMGFDVLGQSLKENHPDVLLPGDETGEQTALMLLTKKHPKQTPPSKKDEKLLEAAKAALPDSFWDEIYAEMWKPPKATDEEREVLASHIRGKDGGKPSEQDIEDAAGMLEEQRQQGNAPGIVVNKPKPKDQTPWQRLTGYDTPDEMKADIEKHHNPDLDKEIKVELKKSGFDLRGKDEEFLKRARHYVDRRMERFGNSSGVDMSASDLTADDYKAGLQAMQRFADRPENKRNRPDHEIISLMNETGLSATFDSLQRRLSQGNAPGIVVNKPKPKEVSFSDIARALGGAAWGQRSSVGSLPSNSPGPGQGDSTKNDDPSTDFDIDALEAEPITPEEEQAIAEDPENQPPPKSEETERQKWIRQTIGPEVPEPMMQKVMDEYEAEHSRVSGTHRSHVEAANAVKGLLSPEGRESSFDAIRKDMQAGMNKEELLKKYDAPLRRAVALVRRHYPETAGSDPVQSTLEMIAGSHARLKQPKDMDEAILSRSMEVLPKELRDNQPVDPEKLDSWIRESLGADATDERVDEVKSQYNAILKSVRSRSNAYHGLSKEYRDLAARAGHPDMADFLKKEAMKGMPLDESRDLLNKHVPDLVERFSRFHPQVAGKDPAGNLALLLAGTHPQQLKLEAMSDWVLKQAIKDSASPEQEEAEDAPVDDAAPYSDDQRKREELTASRLEGATANGNATLGKWKQIQIRDAKEIDRQVKAFEQRAKQLGIDANLGDISDDMRWWQKSDGTIGTLFDVKHDLDASGGFHAAVDRSYASAVDSYREASDLAKSFGYEPDMRNLNKAVMGELNEAVLDAASRLGMDMLSFSPDEQVPKAFEYLKGQKEYLSKILEEADRLGYIDPGVPGKQVDLLEQIENASNWIIGEAHNAGFKPDRQMISQGKSAMLEAALNHLSTKKASDEAAANKGIHGFIKRLGGPKKVLAGLALMATILMILASLERSTRRR